MLSSSRSPQSSASLARAFRALLSRVKPELDVTPKQNWVMGLDPSTPAAIERAEIWEAMLDYPDAAFPLQLQWYDDLKLEFGHPSEMARQLFVHGCYDPNEFNVLKALLKPGMTFVDVGANDGKYSTVAASLVGPGGSVFALEPSRREAAALRRNALINRLLNIRTLELAAGAAEATAKLSVADAMFDGHNSLTGLAVSKHTNLRYTVDGTNFFWTSFHGEATQIALGKAHQAEVLIYSDVELDFDLRDIVVSPQDNVISPWLQTSSSERALTIPDGVQGTFSNASVTCYGDILPRMARGNLQFSSRAAAGVYFRWKLDDTMDSIITIHGKSRSSAPAEEYVVDVVPLDTLFARPGMPKVDAVKIDVEGFELDVLNGARNLISTQRPLILIEVANDLLETKKASVTDIARFLHENGYILFDAHMGKPRLVDLLGQHGSNVFAVPERFLDQMLKLGGLDRKALTAGLKEAGDSGEASAGLGMKQESHS